MRTALALVGTALAVVVAPPWNQSTDQFQVITWTRSVLVSPERDTLVPYNDVRIGPAGQILLPQAGLRRYMLLDSTGRRTTSP